MMPEPFAVRRWQDSDAENLRRFSCANPQFPSSRTYQLMIRGELCDLLLDGQSDLEAIVAEGPDGSLLGLVAFGPTPRPTVWVVHMVGVARAHQGRGVGTALKGRALASCGVRGARKVISSVHAANLPMQRVNEKLGIDFKPEAAVEPGVAPDLFYAAILDVTGA